MKKVIEQIKEKKLAKKIAGVTLGAFAFGAMSAVPAYAAYLHGGSKVGNDYIGSGSYEVTIDKNSAGGTQLNAMITKIYGRKETSSVGIIKGSVKASGFTDTSIMGIDILGGYSSVAGASGSGNTVTWGSDAKVTRLSGIKGFDAQVAGALVSAELTEVDVQGVTIQTSVYGVQLGKTSGGPDKAQASTTNVTLKNTDVTTVYGVDASAKNSATAETTKVTINGGRVGIVYGAQLSSTNTDDSYVTATGTAVTLGNEEAVTLANHVYATNITGKKSATASKTQLTLNGVTTENTSSEVYGDYVKSDTLAKATGTEDADKPTVSITGGKLNKVFGAYFAPIKYDGTGAEAQADGITVKLKDANLALNVESDLYGVSIGKIKNSEIKNTKIDVTGGENKHIYGVYQNFDAGEKLTANTTTITLKDAKGSDIYGVYGKDINEIEATDTKITVETSAGKTSTASNVKGVYFNGKKSATAEGTEVEIKDGEIFVDVYGTHLNVEENENPVKATGTKVTLNNTKVTQRVYGDRIAAYKEATSDGAEVKITGGEGANNIYGADIEATRGDEGEAAATNTTVTVENISEDLKHYVVGAGVSATKKAKADTTTVEITGGKINEVFGANVVANGDEGEATATGTTVTLNGVNAVGNVVGALACGKKSVDVENTKLNITGGKIDSVLLLAGVVVEDISSKEMKVNGTKITLDGIEAETDLYGVASYSSGSSPYTTVINGKDNEIIFDGVKNTIKGTVYGTGKLSFAPGGADFATTNTALTINNIGNEVGNIANFDTINFKLPDNLQANDVMLKLTKAEDTDLKNTTVTTAKVVDAQYAKLNDKDKIYLIDKEGGNLLLKEGTVGQEVILVENSTTTKKGTTALDGNDLVLNISEGGEPGPVPPDPKEEEKADNRKDMTETVAAAVALLNSGADFATEQAMNEAKAAAKEGTMQGATSMSPFAAFGGSSMKYKSGSHIDAKGWNAALGFAKEQGELTYGIAVEHGQANYDSYVNAAHGEGKNKYTGGVIFAELKKESGAHFDASFRAGRAKSDYDATLYVGGIATPTRYDTSSTYLGFSIGAGKETKVSEAGTLDLYARYYFNHLGGSNTKTADGRELEFKDSDSSRLRLGTRFTQKMDERNKLYAGLAWQYEFAGKAKAVINGVDAPSPSMKGHSGMAELGWKAKASKNLDIDLGVNGWLGKQRGIAGNIGFKWTF